MPSHPSPPTKYGDWLVSPALPSHISLLSSWIGLLDPHDKIDMLSLERHLALQIQDEASEDTIEHLIGSFQGLPVFYLAGRKLRLSKSFKMISAPGPKAGYEIYTMLLNPVIESSLTLPAYYHAIRSIFESSRILRIIISVELRYQLVIDALKTIGFNPIQFDDHSIQYQCFGCRKSDFIAL